MKTEFFYQNYNLFEEKVISITSTGNEIYIDIQLDIFMPYVGNGLRSSFDYHPTHRFSVKQKDKIFKIEYPKITTYKIKDNSLIIGFNDMELSINVSDIECIQNIDVEQ